MKVFDSVTNARFETGEEDYLDAITFLFDSAIINVFPGTGKFTWTDETLGTQTFYGLGGLLSIEVPPRRLGNEAQPVTVRLAETYVPVGQDEPVNVFDDGVRASIDEEPWQGREVILSRFWLDANGTPIYREQMDRRVLDAMPYEEDENGRPVRVAILEREDIVQRDVEGKTTNAELQKLIDPDDRSCEFIAATAHQQINFGALPGGTVESTAGAKKSGLIS